jgi:hypothetical protein
MPPTCDSCDGAVRISTDCRYCGRTYCSDHLLPENHSCPGVSDSETLGPDFREYGDEILTHRPTHECDECGRIVKTNRRICYACRTAESTATERDESALKSTPAGNANTCENCGRATATQYDQCFRCRREDSPNPDDRSNENPREDTSPGTVRTALFAVGLLGFGGAIAGPYGVRQQPLVYLIPVVLMLPYTLGYYDLF